MLWTFFLTAARIYIRVHRMVRMPQYLLRRCPGYRRQTARHGLFKRDPSFFKNSPDMLYISCWRRCTDILRSSDSRSCHRNLNYRSPARQTRYLRDATGYKSRNPNVLHHKALCIALSQGTTRTDGPLREFRMECYWIGNLFTTLYS